MKWGISTLADGRIHGRGYGYSVDSSVNDSYGGGTCGEKLIFKGVILLIIIHLQCNKTELNDLYQTVYKHSLYLCSKQVQVNRMV